MEIFSIPIGQQSLIYAPLHGLSAVVNANALAEIRACLQGTAQPSPSIAPLIEQLQEPVQAPRPARSGALRNPFFLGIIPTRGCNMNCRYCDFPAPKQSSPVMSQALARAAVDAYLDLIHQAGLKSTEIHFFGGEPLSEPELVRFVVDYAGFRSAALGIRLGFEVITNGVYPIEWARWTAEHFDRVVLSLDGRQDIQERQRPGLRGENCFEQVIRSARIFSDGPLELILRSCVTDLNVGRLAETARWMAAEFRPSTVCFESLVESPLSRSAGIGRPDPYQFASQFIQAAAILEQYGICAVLSTADLTTCQDSFCPVGRDTLIVSPNGDVDACYLQPEDWQRAGLDLHIGRISSARFEIDAEALQRVRDLAGRHKPLCANCLCRYHCAGGCHVNHFTNRSAGEYDDQCIQTRLVTVARLLSQAGQDELLQEWMSAPARMHFSAQQISDRLF